MTLFPEVEKKEKPLLVHVNVFEDEKQEDVQCMV